MAKSSEDKVPVHDPRVARKTLEGIMFVFMTFGVGLTFFPTLFLKTYGVNTGANAEATAAELLIHDATVNVFWCMLGLHLFTISMIMRAGASCNDIQTMGLLCFAYMCCATAQIGDLLVATDAKAAGFDPMMILFNVAIFGVTGTLAFFAWRSSGSVLPKPDRSGQTNLVNVLRASEFFYALYGFGCAFNGNGMYTTYLKGVEFQPELKPVLDQAIHATGIAMLCIVVYTEFVVMGAHVETQYALVRAFSYTWMMSCGFIAANNLLVPLLGWPEEMTSWLILVNLGMSFLNMRVITAYDRAQGIAGEAALPKKMVGKIDFVKAKAM